MPELSKPLTLNAKSLTIGNRADRLPANLKLRRRSGKRAFLDARRETSVIEHILELPAPGDSLHIVIDGRFTPCDIIPAIRRLSDPAVIERLDIATLGFNRDNVETIARGMDQGMTHAKVMLFEMTDGNCYTVEGSANLRSCSSIEQICITNDRDLLNFHRVWIEDFLNRKAAR